MQNQNNKQVGRWKWPLFAVIFGSIIGYLNAKFEIRERFWTHYEKIPIIDMYLNWIESMRDVVAPNSTSFVRVLVDFLAAIAAIMPVLGVILIIAYSTKYVAKAIKSMQQER
ncbi:MAG TPA: hypothetical protein VLH56_04220 [Dissulfurispiraceae bacterium]|nr:hypothetical protein [Dissulfurispiraceae bacterium]